MVVVIGACSSVFDVCCALFVVFWDHWLLLFLCCDGVVSCFFVSCFVVKR